MHFINGFNQLFADSKDSIISNKYKEIKEYQKEFKKDPKALVALGNLLAMNKNYDQANAVADYGE